MGAEPLKAPTGYRASTTVIVETLPYLLSGAPVLDIQSRYRYGYSLSPYLLQLSQGIALYPLIRGKANQIGGATSGIAAQAASGGNRAIGPNRSYTIANRGLMSHKA